MGKSRKDAIANFWQKKQEGRSTTDRDGYWDDAALETAGLRVWSAKEGNCFIATVPPPKEDLYFWLEVYIHWKIGLMEGNYACPRMMNIGPCPICEEYQRLKRDGCDDKALLSSVNPFPPSYLFYVVDFKDEESVDQGVQVYRAPTTILNEILAHSTDKRSGETIDISDPKDGKILCFVRKGLTMQNTKYSGFSLEDRDALPEEWLDLPQLSSLLKFYPYDYLKDVYDGAVVETTNDDDDEDVVEEDVEEEKKPIRRIPVPKRAKKQEDVEEEADEEEADDEEADDSKSAMVARLKAKVSKARGDG